jgi:hypothetical protein
MFSQNDLLNNNSYLGITTNDYDGKSNDTSNSYPNSKSLSNNNENNDREDDVDYDNLGSNIYRFKFNDEIMREIHNFAKIHQFDERKDFKEAWTVWINENEEIISQETNRLNKLGYEGDIIDKMFKSARYYYRKKSTEKKEPVKRRRYIGLQKEFLDIIDKHISENYKKEDYKPSNGFEIFCKENMDLLQDEIKRLINYNITDKTEIKNKIKKTYKNRYFILINK